MKKVQMSTIKILISMALTVLSQDILASVVPASLRDNSVTVVGDRPVGKPLHKESVQSFYTRVFEEQWQYFMHEFCSLLGIIQEDLERLKDILSDTMIYEYKDAIPADQIVQDKVDRLCKQLGVEAKIKVMQADTSICHKNSVAIATGNKFVTVNNSFLLFLPECQDVILCHELSHIKYGDDLYKSIFQQLQGIAAQDLEIDIDLEEEELIAINIVDGQLQADPAGTFEIKKMSPAQLRYFEKLTEQFIVFCERRADLFAGLTCRSLEHHACFADFGYRNLAQYDYMFELQECLFGDQELGRLSVLEKQLFEKTFKHIVNMGLSCALLVMKYTYIFSVVFSGKSLQTKVD